MKYRHVATTHIIVEKTDNIVSPIAEAASRDMENYRKRRSKEEWDKLEQERIDLEMQKQQEFELNKRRKAQRAEALTAKRRKRRLMRKQRKQALKQDPGRERSREQSKQDQSGGSEREEGENSEILDRVPS